MEERRKKIVDLVDAEGQITFAQLKSAFPNVSEMTLHTDLKHLNESGRIVRVHGGARSAEIVAGAEDFFPSGFNGIESKSKQSLKRPLPCFKRIELSFWIPAYSTVTTSSPMPSPCDSASTESSAATPITAMSRNSQSHSMGLALRLSG